MLPAERTANRSRLQSRFITGVIVLTLLVSSLIVIIEQIQVDKAIVKQTRAQGSSIANTIASTAGYYVMFDLTSDLESIMADLKKSEAVEYADFLAADGKILVASDPRRMPEAVRKMKLTSKPVDFETTTENGELHLYVRPFFEARGSAGLGDAKPRGYFRLAINEIYARRAVRELAVTNFLVILVSLGVGIGLAVFGSRLIVRPILNLVKAAEEISRGDLTRRTEVSSQDEIGTLSGAFNTMAGNFEKTMSKIVQSQSQITSVVETVRSRSANVIGSADEQRVGIDEAYVSIDQLNSGIRKISENVESLSASSEQTSSSMLQMVASMEEVTRHTDSLFSSVEETASATHQMVASISEVDQSIDFLQNFVTDTSSSMVQMSASIGQVEGNAARSYDLAVAVADAAESGMKAVRETIEGMEQIRQSVLESNTLVSRLGERSEEIGKIVNVIEDVAEQTSLLALNAAILAAQAGEHGKGFSVVAAEIRELSERTSSSTREIASLITSVQDEVTVSLKSMTAGSEMVEAGVGLSHEAGKALNRILDSSLKASNMGKEIANATKEQARGSETVGNAIERLQEMVKQISSATSQQATGSEHILKAVESMREVTRHVRQATVEQKSGSMMISKAAERMIDMIHEIFEVTASQAGESEKVVRTMEQIREIAEGNRRSAGEMNESVGVLVDSVRGLDEEVRKFKIRG